MFSLLFSIFFYLNLHKPCTEKPTKLSFLLKPHLYYQFQRGRLFSTSPRPFLVGEGGKARKKARKNQFPFSF
ncbi:hypothetical protein DRP98_09365 [candidate division KSB1 bacterium]|nr:MAG: hypothetical protein DRP98_09365 [candidate division KSB1 bacterium]